ncbi:MAG: hypothetical protein Q8P18_02275 [Pseudomonadota bacterium]|nr:hypothetical protein [Pseudomonadota bacterium]
MQGHQGLQLPPDKLAFVTRALKAARVDVVRETTVRLADARARYDRLRRMLDKAYEDKLEGRVEAAQSAASNCELRSGTVVPKYRKPFDALAELASAKNEDGAESLGGTLRHPVWSGRPDSNR